MVLGLLLTTIISILAIVNPYISGMIVDEVITGGKLSLLPKLIIALLAATSIRGILRYYYQVVFETCSQGVLYEMRDKVYRKLLQEDFAFYNRKRTGDLMSRQTGDMDAIRHFVAYVIYAVYVVNFIIRRSNFIYIEVISIWIVMYVCFRLIIWFNQRKYF